MDNINLPNQYIKNLYRALFVFLIVLSLFFVVKLLAEFRSYGMMDSSESNTITLSGHGEIMAVPDIANIYFTIKKEAKTVKEAQNGVAEIEKRALDFLKENGVADKDIKTIDASFNPKYEWKLRPCPYDPSMGVVSRPCPGGKNELTGYEASESINVKIRNTDNVGKIIQGLGGLGVTDLNGPNFTIDNEDALKAQARKKAIDDAREKAQALAKDLGVRLGKISSFSENGNYPIYYAESAMMKSDTVSAPAPAQIPKGENTISSDVTIIWEIR
ncbi:hypothetical protein A3A03_02200 [Candidatus Nomurabacteria bacterium RIFCSPLOWO2_01_FULL_40_18]|uniref:26 kDa periplasmic immunogenic protein n=1 Tax=Candidatus Nomurabacteria bacterium RIFCSPLOWO2_01_FULL_40_18 TaxID=1801773 RepID=A0A1F6XLL6_9BACT|nr:MAG: hypothetical protein A3A03_02200 [Candidatus Nomurabacteria bacterium RIFCSPLOWO2_01_FULL_40_18]